ncbi:MAG: ATP-binding protein [Flavobacteriales bacterium]|jgi:PAS domain S-box-containing protein|nr:ATP-binding protein [Flavobacteriales bacterium]
MAGLDHNDERQIELQTALELYNNAPCGAVSFYKNGIIFEINQTMLDWLGYERDELVNKKTLPSLFRVGGQIFFETHFFPLIQMQGFIKEVYFDILHKDKSVFHGLINARKVPTSADQPNIYQATILDISDRWNYEMELLKAKRKAEADSKAKAEFLATISHEIRTPLNAILGIGNLLHATPLNENQKEYARLLLHSSENLLGLVNNLLDLSKIEARMVELEEVSFNLHDLVEVLQETYSVKASNKGIALQVELGENVKDQFVGDPVKLNQILTNLVGNAIKFTKEGGVTLKIHVKAASSTSQTLHFEIIDTGIGIPPEKLELIFQEFSQASYDVSVEFGGTGLGLTISQKLLELHHSKMIVKSILNEGSSFSFTISYTLDKDASSKKGITTKSSDLEALMNCLVLIVDDNPDNIFIASQYLNQWHVPYHAAKSGKKALQLVEQYDFDLILLDLQMPKMDGYQTAKAIRELPLKSQPSIVAFSASTKGEVSEKLQQAQIDDHLPKPFKPNELLEVLLHRESFNTSNVASESSESPLKTSLVSTKSASEEIDTAPSFSIQRYEKMANNKPEFIKKFVLSTLDGLITYKEDFDGIIKNNDLKSLSALIHKSTMSLYYIEAEQLSAMLKEYRELITNPAPDTAQIEKVKSDCLNEFTIIIEGLNKTASQL